MEFEQILKKALKGSQKECEEIVWRLEPLIKSSIKRYYYRSYLYQDLLQEGRLMVLTCLRTYDPDRGIHFLGYVKMKLRYLYLNMNKEGECLSLDQEKEGLSLLDRLSSKENIEADYEKRECQGALLSALEELTEIEKSIVLDFYFHNQSLQDMASARNVSYRTIVNNKTRALKKLENRLGKNNPFSF